MALTPGTRLGTYQITGSLGAGGMGEVYRARDTRLGREVAVKLLPAAVSGNADRLARFEREARTVAGLSHPNIVTLYAVEDADGVRFLTMELVDGRSLDRVVTPGGLPLTQVLELATPIASALVAAHERGVVHRDLKPGNVMVTRDGWVKVLDFGLAKVAAGDEVAAESATIGATAAAPISFEGQVVGTVPYMAPEQIRGETVDARSDLFALGIILYELATGRRPFTGATPADVSSSILRDVPVPVVNVRADLPRDMHRIISRCLEKQPRDRFQTARDVYNELRYVQRELDSGGFASPAPAAPPAAPSSTPASSPAMSGGAPAPASPASASPMPSAGASRSATFASATPSGGGAAAAPHEVPSIAVLPFVNRSRDEEDEYFSDGLADELLNGLTKIRGVRVAARASSFHFKGRNEDLAAIGKALNVETLLDGSVRKAGNRVRISVQLVHAADRVQIWSETYDRPLDDIFAVQDDIAQAVVKELRTTLLGEASDSGTRQQARAEVEQAFKGYGHDPEAHRLYLQGKYLVGRVNEADNARGMAYLERALALDPTHAMAWVELSRSLTFAAGYGWMPVGEGFARASEAVTRALALAPDLADAHAQVSHIERLHGWDWAVADRAARRALELAPGSAEALRGMGNLAMDFGRLEEAESLLVRGIQQDPLNAASYSAMAHLYRRTGRLAEAERVIRKSIELLPQRISTHLLLSIVLTDMGRDAEALAEANLEAAEWARLTALAYVHGRAGRMAESDAALRQLEARHAHDSAYQIGAIYAGRGDLDNAFTWLGRAIDMRDAGATLMVSEPVFRPLHGDPRWGELLKRMGMSG